MRWPWQKPKVVSCSWPTAPVNWKDVAITTAYFRNISFATMQTTTPSVFWNEKQPGLFRSISGSHIVSVSWEE